MSTGGVVSAIVVGLVVGALARLVLPGRQKIGVLLTLLIGLVAAFVGGYVGEAITDDGGFNLLTLVIQVVLAVVVVAVVAGTSRRSVRR